MDTTRINNINSALMLLSVAIAWFVPFQLFLFAYAVLGPLHYLTEIHWLHKKDYFTQQRLEPLLLLIAGACLFILLFIPSSAILPAKIFLWTFFAAALMTTALSKTKKLLAYLAFFLFLLILPRLSNGVVLFAMLLPTLIHVYLFTGIFICYGMIMKKNLSGKLSLSLYIIIPIVLVLGSHASALPLPTRYVTDSYHLFEPLNQALLHLFGQISTTSGMSTAVYLSALGIAIMRCIAFAYTYHYLNWFTKTKVIRWNTMSKQAWGVIIVLWVLALTLYAIDYRLGLFTLYFLSALHVILEFPLNWKTFFAIGGALRKNVTPE
jgi:hypothetical protein